ncbi:DUF4124 domain-containing protein [Pseudomonas sp. A46]|nr:DUF4124 domain-containing protein [Pseudomonas sp. A46]OWJ97203.1 DUF4124 domain-containing protein [Pseudomonas sp. A46]
MSPRAALAVLALLLAHPLSAQVYQWRDADGKVHFTDTPPPQSQAVEGAQLPAGDSAVPLVAAEPKAPPAPSGDGADPLYDKGRKQCAAAIARMPVLINQTQTLGRDAVKQRKISQEQLDRAMYLMDDFYKGLKRSERECTRDYVISEKGRSGTDCLADTPDVLSFGVCMRFAEWERTFR